MSFEGEIVTLTLDGAPFEVVRLSGREAVSTMFRFELVCRAEYEHLSAAPLLGRHAVIVLTTTSGARTVEGVVSEAEARAVDDGATNLRLVVRPAHHKLSLGRDCRAFHDLDVVGIARDVFGRAGVPVRYETTGRYATRAYTVQYREDDLSFLSRLFEEEGIYYWFDGGTLVLADDSTASPPIDGNPILDFSPERGMRASKEVLTELASEAAAAPGRFVVRSFDPDRPNLEVQGAAGGSGLEVYSCRGGGVVDPAHAAERARVRKERAAASSQGVAGRTNSARPAPGRYLQVTLHPLSRYDAPFFLTEVTTEATQRMQNAGAGGAASAFDCRFRGLLRSVPFRPARVTPLSKQSGLQQGVVVGAAGEEIHPDATGRVRVQMYWDRLGKRDERAGHWLRVAQRGTGSSMLLPRIGWTVLTFNEEGTVDAPSVLSRIFDGEHMPPYPLPANKTRLVLKTLTSPGGGSANEIRFEDKKGVEELFINASRDMNVMVLNEKKENVHNDQVRSIGANQTLSVTDSFIHAVAQDQSVNIGGNETETTDGKKNKNVQGAEVIRIGGKRSLKTGGGHDLGVDKDRSLKVGAAMLDVSLNTITASAGTLHSTLVGGAAIKIVKNGMTDDVGKVALATVGGVKLEVAKKDRTLDVRKVLYEAVGAMMLFDAQKKYIDSSEKETAFRSAGKLTGKAPEVWIEATEKIEVILGGAKITVLPDKVEFLAPKFDLSKASLVKYVTAAVTHN